MKKRNKRLLAVAMSAAMSCSMVTGWANTAEIVSVLKNEVAVDLTQSFEVTPNDVVEVKVKITDGADPATVLEAVEATFLTYKDNTAGTDEALLLDNTTIQYVDQQTTAKAVDSEGNATGDAYATFTFRPRMNGEALLLSGAHTAKVGGTAVDSPTPFTYTVAAAKIDMNVSAGQNTSFTQNEASAGATFTLDIAEGVTPTEVKLGDTTLTSEQYSYAYPTLTITADTLNGLTVGSYTLTVSATGYNDGTLVNAIVVTEAAAEDVDSTHKNEVVEELKDVEIPTEVTVDATNNKASIALTAGTTQTGSYDVKYAINTATEGVSIENNAIVLDTSVKPFAKVEVKVYAGTGETAYDVKTVYIVPEPENVGFGNIGLHTDGTSDPFVYDSEDTDADTNFRTYVNNTIGNTAKLEQRVIARNIVLGKGSKTDLPHFEGALDYNQDGNLALAEYRIYKLMMDGNDDNHSFSKVNGARAEWIAKAKEEAAQQ